MKEFTISKNDSNQRVDKFVLKAAPLLSKNLMYKYIRTKRIKVNGKKCDISTKLLIGDKVEMYINDEFFANSTDFEFLIAKTDIDIIYEDDNILLINKPVGLIVHEDKSNSVDTLINRILHYLYQKREYIPQNENSFIPALCNRIDRNTSGIVIAAKNAEALRELNKIIKEREITKKYYAIVHGIPKQNKAILKHYHVKDSATNIVKILNTPTNDSKTIITKYWVENSINNFSLVEIELVTGRTHQIRAHMSYIGHPLLGDTKYGLNKNNKQTGYKFQALCAKELIFKIKDVHSPLSYLNKNKFEIKNISFVKDFYDKKIHND